MKYNIIKFFTFLILCSSVSAQNYFIRLTPAGMNQKEALINREISNPAIQPLLKKSTAEFLPAIKKTLSAHEFSGWLTLSAIESITPQLLDHLLADGIIDYYEPVGVFTTPGPAEGSEFGEQWHLPVIDAQSAWQVTTGNNDVLVGVIDTGIDYRHPDLRGGLWYNELECNGLPNYDDDQNGFIDDSLGWDFTDAPRLADGGDYLNPDNDPMDEYGSGHGTQIAGIISGQKVNDTGVIGVAPGVKVMNLRAGTASGYLEEDDVANAVLYAVDNGASVINMSFGDVVISRLLKDVLLYAHEQNVILIGSAGNSGNDQPNYPASLDQVISVGATTQDDALAGYSNYGNSVDLLAPGSGIYSTAVNNSYNKVSGTSFAAPMVSALAALLKSIHPDYNYNRIKNIMKTTVLEFPEELYNHYLGAGRIDAGMALRVPHGGKVEITDPGQFSSTALDSLWIKGSIAHPASDHYSVSFGYGSQPVEWRLLTETAGKQVIDDTIGLFILSDIPDTVLTLKTQLFLNDGTNQTERIQFRIDRTPPAISSVKTITMLDGDTESILISFVTDDVTRARIFLRPEGESDLRGIESGYETQSHRIKLNRLQFDGAYEFMIEAENESGLSSIDDAAGNWYSFEMDLPYVFYPFENKGWHLPPGYLLDKTSDVNKNTSREVVISAYDDNNAFGPLEIYEFSKNQFELIFQGGEIMIPRDVGDVNQNGLVDILTGFGETASILEFDTAGGLEGTIIWQDALWAAAFSDLDNDGLWEIIGRQSGEYVILEDIGNNKFEKVATLLNPTAGENQYGIPRVEQIDLDGDGVDEIAFGDYDGDVVIYQNTGDNSYSLFATFRTLQPDATEMLSGLNEENQPGILYAGSHTLEDYQYEHELDAKFRSVELLQFFDDKQMVTSTDTTHYFGYRNSKEYDSGLKLSRLNNDIFLFASFFPNLYALHYDNGQLNPVWHFPQSRSNTILVDDLNGDGIDEVLFNSGRQIHTFSLNTINRPPTPYPLMLEKVDSNSIVFSWSSTSGDSYKIHRGNRMDSLVYYKQIDEAEFRDEMLPINTTFYYAVTLVDSSFDNPESAQSRILKATTGVPPRLVTVKAINNRQLILTFSEKITFRSAPSPVVYQIGAGKLATSFLRMGDQTKLLASFNHPFKANIIDSIQVNHIFNKQWIELDSEFRSLEFVYIQPENEPYVAGFERNSDGSVRLEFSESMRRSDLLIKENYRITPRGGVDQIDILDSSDKLLRISLSDDTPPGNAGFPLYLNLDNLHSVSGKLLRENAIINLNKTGENIQDVIIYPQPVHPHHDVATFGNLPHMVKIVIYNLSGKIVRLLEGNTEYGAMEWDLKDDRNQNVASGVYIYIIEFDSEKKIGKLAIVR